MWIYGKLWLKARHKAINTILEYYRVAHQSKKSRVELSSCPRCTMQGHSFWLAVWLNMGLRVGFFYPPSIIVLWGHWSSVSIGWPIGAMYSWVRSHIKEDPEKGIGRLKAGSTDWRHEALATLFTTTATLPRVLNLTIPSNINLLKTDSRLTVIATQLITSYSELKPLLVVVHDFF